MRTPHFPHFFCVAKRKKRHKGKKETLKAETLKAESFKVETLKGCHQGQNVTVLAILKILKFNLFFLAQPWWLTILLSVPGPLHFESHFSGPEQTLSG